MQYDIDDDEIIDYIIKNYDPEEVYGNEQLERWAENNGYVYRNDR